MGTERLEPGGKTCRERSGWASGTWVLGERQGSKGTMARELGEEREASSNGSEQTGRLGKSSIQRLSSKLEAGSAM